MKYLKETFDEPELTEQEFRDMLRRKLKALKYEQNFIEQTINKWIKREILISKDNLFFHEETSIHIDNFTWSGHSWYTNKGPQIQKDIKRMSNRLMTIHEKIADVEFVLTNIAKFHKARNTRLLNAKIKPNKQLKESFDDQQFHSEKDEIKYLFNKFRAIGYEGNLRGNNPKHVNRKKY